MEAIGISVHSQAGIPKSHNVGVLLVKTFSTVAMLERLSIFPFALLLHFVLVRGIFSMFTRTRCVCFNLMSSHFLSESIHLISFRRCLLLHVLLHASHGRGWILDL